MIEKEGSRNVTNHFEAGSNCQVFNGPVSGCVFAMPGANVVQNTDSKPKEQQSEDKPIVSAEVVCSALNRCKSFLWGNAAYAVAFCVCRDLYGWQDNASLFERQLNNQGVDLPIGTINTAISRNAYMRLNVRKWGVSDAMERALKLRDELQHQIDLAAVCNIEA